MLNLTEFINEGELRIDSFESNSNPDNACQDFASWLPATSTS
jgi:hypothetical protein